MIKVLLIIGMLLLITFQIIEEKRMKNISLKEKLASNVLKEYK